MKIANEKPPIYDEAHRHFEIDDSMTLYTYGETLYNPADIEVTQDLLAHENMHRIQQQTMGPERWWKMYFDNPSFRADQEAQAYATQYEFYTRFVSDRNKRYQYLDMVATFMASPLYKLGMSKAECLKLIRHFY